MTPYELRLPAAQGFDARFEAFDGLGLSGEITTRSGEVSGTALLVPLRLHFAPGGRFGFEGIAPGRQVVP
jgi:hypothetical protein